MSADLELEVWREQWQAEDIIPEGLRKNVERQSRLMTIGIVCDVMVTVIIGGGSTVWAFLSEDSGTALVAIASWLFLAAAWIFVLTMSQGLWKPQAVDTAAYLAISLRRCRNALSTVWFAGGMFVAEVIFGLSWSYVHLSIRRPLLEWLAFSSVRIDIVWICTGFFFAVLLWYRNKKKAELRSLLRMREELVPADAID